MIEITEKNYKQIFGRVKKFFKTNKEYESWYSYDCGKNRKMPKYFKAEQGPIATNEEIEVLEIINNEITAVLTIKYRIKHFAYYHGLKIGDSIIFLGNRIMIKQKTHKNPIFKYVYYIYQIK
jgi:hypothetical protein